MSNGLEREHNGTNTKTFYLDMTKKAGRNECARQLREQLSSEGTKLPPGQYEVKITRIKTNN